MTISQRSIFVTCRIGSLLAIALLLATSTAQAAGPQAVPDGKRPNDQRLKPLKDLNGYFPFQQVESAEAWPARKEQLRRRILVANGLWPLPSKTPLNAVVHTPVEEDGYTVERVYFESMPGFYVTGSLYRPKGKEGPHPAVLCPHGHWANGRFYDSGRDSVRKQIVIGAERFEDGGRSPLQARCVQLARMGCIVFHYDMLGYADSKQLSFELVHRFGKQRPEMNTLTDWGLYSTQAEAHLQSVMGLQTWNSIRSLDFLESLDDVDTERLAITGASGGGTQTMLLAAIDDRLAVSMPAVMVSTAMQGGCTCESCSLLRINGGNIDFAALFAPKPQRITAADDWTREVATKGFPDLEAHYKMLGAEKDVALTNNIHFKHNYNYPNRATLYSWFNKYLKLGHEEPVVEEAYRRLSTEEMTVWDKEHPQPEGGEAFEKQLMKWWLDDAQATLGELKPTDKDSLKVYREVIGGGVDTVIGAGLPDQTDLDYEATSKVDKGDYLEIASLLRDESRGAELPTVYLYPDNWNGQAVIWISEQGKAGLYDDNGKPIPAVQRLIDSGSTVIGVDLLFQGEFRSPGEEAPKQTRKVENPREAAAYTFGYNHSLFAERVHDLLTLVAFTKHHELTPKSIELVGIDGSGHWVAAARAQARDTVDRCVIDTEGFRFSKLLDYRHVDFTAGGAKYFDLPGMMSLSAPSKLMVAGESANDLQLVRDAYAAAEAGDSLTRYEGNDENLAESAVDWLLE